MVTGIVEPVESRIKKGWKKVFLGGKMRKTAAFDGEASRKQVEKACEVLYVNHVLYYVC